MPDSAAVAPERHRPGGRTLTLLTIPIVILVIMNNVGDAVAPAWFDHHPLGLLALNSRNRNLILVTNNVGALGYYVVATLRLAVADPLFFLLGYWYGEAAMRWMEQRSRTFGKTLRQWEGWFSKAAYPFVFVMPNNPICLFAGASGMSVTGFFTVNLAGTLTRLYLIRRLGETFETPIHSVSNFIQDHRTPLLVLTIGLAVVFLLSELRGGSTNIEEIEEIEAEIEAEADAEADSEAEIEAGE